ncbi:hypothetical protein [Dactylosporangium sp. NPDC005555]|uniref:hypothetical protein n=1 Tax=Dactylosporangium sp. NPDC005555 TaxID=3154889 RepID=UPI0033B76C99
MGEHSTDDDATMGTTGTPGTEGADAIDDPDRPNGSAEGARTSLGFGGQADAPGLPFDRKPQSDDPVHSIRND